MSFHARARDTASSSEMARVLRQHFMAPSTRSFFVIARVSTSLIPGIPFLREVVAQRDARAPVAHDRGEFAHDEPLAFGAAASASSSLMP